MGGFSRRHEIDLALAALEQGPLSEEECVMMRRYGAVWRQQFDLTGGLQNKPLPAGVS